MAVLIRAAAILLLALLAFLYLGKFTFVKRLIFGALVLVFIGIVVFYELSYTKQSKLNKDVLSAFNQNQTLICEGHEVTASEFTFVGGTKVFTHKNRGQSIVSIENCEVK
ncbi:MAG: hypothetical protein LBC08_01615 [Campylobacteraceae bacterium]|nr:hypothetical protein [Campylobacteraceae bacterium]